MQQPTFATARLIIRPAEMADLAALHSLWSHSDVRRFLFDDQPVSLDLAQSVLNSCLSSALSGVGLWLVEDQQGSRSLGCVGLNPTTTAAEYEPSLAGLLEPVAAFGPSNWHRGYAHESLSELLSYAFGPLAQPKLAAVNDAPNIASEKMLLKLGFIEHSEVEGPRYRLRTYHLQRAAWEAQHP